MKKTLQKMQQARAALVLDHPFFATLALHLRLEADPACSTAWSDGTVLACNPSYIADLPLSKLMGIFCHEVLHLVCAHHLRRNGREARLWNRACDLAINPLLLEAGVSLPDGYLSDAVYRGQPAEKIYDQLMQDSDTAHGGGSGGKDEQQGGAFSDGQGRGDLGGQSSGSGGSSQGAGQKKDRGSGGGKSVQAGEDADPGRSGEVRDAPLQVTGQSDARKRAENFWKTVQVQAAREAREAGKLPGALERFFADKGGSVLEWKEILRRFLHHAGRNDFTWVRPNRRFIYSGLYLPGLHSQELNSVVVVLDVSGSIDAQTMDMHATEIQALLDEFSVDALFMACDAAVRTFSVLDAGFSRQRVSGGGGTDFRPPFAALDKEGLVPDCLIYFTDLQCRAYPKEPEYPVLWLCRQEPQHPPPFGEVAVMEKL